MLEPVPEFQTSEPTRAVSATEPSKPEIWKGGPLGLCLLAAIIFIGGAIAPPALLDDADSAHAEVAREMAQSGDWVTLHMDGIKYFEKDPLMYWLIAGSFRVFGATEFPARLPLALATVLTVLAVWALAAQMFGGRGGFYAGLIFATSVGPFLFTRILIPDILITGLVTAALYFFVKGLDDSGRRPRHYLGIYVCCALAFLTKSLIGIVFPAGIIFLFLLITRRFREIRRLRLIEGIAIFLILAVPWVVLAGIRNDRFLWFHFINEQVYRYLGKRYPMDYDTVPLLVFYSLHALWIFPWTFFLPGIITYFPRRLAGMDRDKSMTLLLLIWIAVIVGFFSFSTRQEYYTLPALPAFAILCGKLFADFERAARSVESSGLKKKLRRYASIGHWSLAGIGLACLAASILVLIWLRGIVIGGDISTVLTKNPDYYALSLGHIFDLTPLSFAALRGPVIGAGAALGLGSALSLVLYRRQRVMAAALAIAGMMAALFYCTHESMKVFEPYLSSKSLALDVLRTFRPGEKIVINGEYESGSTMNFYSRQPIYMLNNRSSNLEFGSYLPGAPQRFFDDEGFRTAWSGEDRIYLVTDASLGPQIRQLVSPLPAYDFAASADKLVLSNRP